MQEEIQMIKEALEMYEFELKAAKLRHYICWFCSLLLIAITVFIILTSSPLAFFSIIGAFIYAGMAYWNIKYHNNLVLDIEDLECALEELTKE